MADEVPPERTVKHKDDRHGDPVWGDDDEDESKAVIIDHEPGPVPDSKPEEEEKKKKKPFGFMRLPTVLQAEVISYSTMQDYFAMRIASKTLCGGVTTLPTSLPSQVVQTRGLDACGVCHRLKLDARIAPFSCATTMVIKYEMRNFYQCMRHTYDEATAEPVNRFTFLPRFNRLRNLTVGLITAVELLEITGCQTLTSLSCSISSSAFHDIINPQLETLQTASSVPSLGKTLSLLPSLAHLRIRIGAPHRHVVIRPGEDLHWDAITSLRECRALTSLELVDHSSINFDPLPELTGLTRLAVGFPSGPAQRMRTTVPLTELPRLVSLTLSGTTYGLMMNPFPALTELDISCLDDRSAKVEDDFTVHHTMGRGLHIFEAMRLSRIETLKRVIRDPRTVNNNVAVPVRALPPGCEWYTSTGRPVVSKERAAFIHGMNAFELLAYNARFRL